MLTPDEEEQALVLLERALEKPDPTAFIEAQADTSDAVRARAIELYRRSLTDAGFPLTNAGLAAAGRLDDWRGRELGDYRITDLIGRGGMGSVFVGERIKGDFEHRAAIKIGHAAVPNDSQLERLRAERRLLARLVHPNIAQLYGGGELDSGAPYIIMEIVDGRPLDQVVTERAPDWRARLDYILQACAGLQYAHQSSVVHLDVSPRNILVTDEGFVKVIDFGVGILVDDAFSRPRSHRTEGFTDPALADGAPATLSDIYSVGRTLEHVMRDVETPRRRDLEAIVTRATAPRPEDRYASIDSLAQDLEAYRNGHAVSARGRDWALSALRFAQRHTIGSLAAVVAGVSLLAGSLVISTLYVKSVAAEQRAEARFGEVRSLANFLLFDLYDRLDEVPGTVDAREEIARLGGTYLDRLSAIEGAPLSLRIETANGYRRLGDITGNPVTGNLGRREDAKPLLEKAYTELTLLRDEAPGDPGVLRALGQTAYSLSVFAFIAEDDNEKALSLAEDAVGFFSELFETGAATREDRFAQLRARAQIADALSFLGRGEEAIAIQRILLAEAKALHAESPDPDTEDMLISTLIETAEVFYTSTYDAAIHEEGIAAADEAIVHLRRRVAIEEEGHDALERLPLALYHKGRILAWLERYDEAAPAFAEAISRAERQRAAEPENLEVLRRLTILRQEYGFSLSGQGEHARAIEEIRTAIERIESLRRDERGDRGYESQLARAYYNLAEAEMAASDPAGACGAASESARRFDALGTVEPYSEEYILPEVRRIVASTCESGHAL